MKAFVRLGIMLLLCLDATHSIRLERLKIPGVEVKQTIDVTKFKIGYKNRQQFVDMINELRMKTAEMYQIANMNELSWDTDLEKRIGSLECRDLKSGPNYMLTESPSYENSYRSMQQYSKEMQDESIIMLMYTYIEPEQSKIGCAALKQQCPGASANMQDACLVGPKNQASEDTKTGSPGSHCPNGKAASGLCKISVTHVITTSIIFIAFFSIFT